MTHLPLVDAQDPHADCSAGAGKTGAPYLVCSQSADLNCLAVGAELHHHEATIDLWSVTDVWDFVMSGPG